MRKICLWASFLIFLSCTLASFKVQDLLSFNISFAQEISPTPIPQVNYELPYPGLLPDSPLYFLRVIRDKTVGFLISDPLKKAEFNLLQADKRLNAGIYLFNKGKTSLALSTVSKAENYFEQALGKMGDAKMEGRNIDEIQGKLRNAVKKHEQELKYFIKKVNASLIVGFEKEQKRVTGFDRRLSQ